MSLFWGINTIVRQYVIVTLLTVYLTVTLTFLTLRVLPGDAISAQLIQVGASSEVIDNARHQLGLDLPIWLQYVEYLSSLVRGDLGTSLVSNQAVGLLIGERIRPTFALAFGALGLSLTMGLYLGILSAFDSFYSRLAGIIINLSISTPIYWTGSLAIIVFSVQLGWFPSTGTGRLEHLVLPVGVLGFHAMGEIARVVQVNVREIRHASFVLAARSRGLHEPHIIWRHVLRVGLIPVITVVSLQAGFLFSGTVITESLFVRPGVGRLLLESTIHQDYPVVQGIVVISTIVYSTVNSLAEILYYVVDPRIRT